MFALKNIIKALGTVVLLTTCISFIIGLFNLGSIPFLVVTFFLVTNVLMGIVGPLYNNQCPYVATFLGSITISVINYCVSYFVFEVNVLVDPDVLNSNLTIGTSISLITALITVRIMNERKHINHA